MVLGDANQQGLGFNPRAREGRDLAASAREFYTWFQSTRP